MLRCCNVAVLRASRQGGSWREASTWVLAVRQQPELSCGALLLLAICIQSLGAQSVQGGSSQQQGCAGCGRPRADDAMQGCCRLSAPAGRRRPPCTRGDPTCIRISACFRLFFVHSAIREQRPGQWQHPDREFPPRIRSSQDPKQGPFGAPSAGDRRRSIALPPRLEPPFPLHRVLPPSPTLHRPHSALGRALPPLLGCAGNCRSPAARRLPSSLQPDARSPGQAGALMRRWEPWGRRLSRRSQREPAADRRSLFVTRRSPPLLVSSAVNNLHFSSPPASSSHTGQAALDQRG